MEDIHARVLRIADAFDRAGIPYSFGGAIALAFYARFRATRDIDVNVYVPVSDVQSTLDALATLEVSCDEADRQRIERDAQTRLWWGHVPVDLFFSNLDFHDSCLARRRRYDLLEREIFVLGPEDLIVCKASFGRSKDQVDIDSMLDRMGDQLDIAYVLRWVDAIVGREGEAVQDLLRALEDRALLPPS